jgi:glycosyltransferase involved in cell wall biosynthesis
MRTPWLSVCIPVFNVRAYLAECVESVMGQAGAGVEILLLEDCSTDGSAQLAAELAARHHPTVQLHRHAYNRGLSAARNSLISVSRGDYLWFLDSDDVLMPGAIASLRAIVDAHHPDLVLCDFRTLREDFRLKHRLRGELHRRTFAGPAGRCLTDRDLLLAGVFRQGHLHAWSKIARRAVWGDDLRFPEGRYFEDMTTTPALLMRSHRYCYADAVWVGYRQRAGSILANSNPDKIDHMMEALAGVPGLLRSPQPPVGPEACFHAAYFAAKTFITACRLDGKRATSERLARHLELFHACSPIAPAALLPKLASRGWLWRAQRLRYWLRRAGWSPSPSSITAA